jgi:hypothetical protein
MTKNSGLYTDEHDNVLQDDSYHPVLTQLGIEDNRCACGPHDVDPKTHVQERILLGAGMKMNVPSHVRVDRVFEVSVNMLAPFGRETYITPKSITYVVEQLIWRARARLLQKSSACSRWPPTNRTLPHEIGALFLETFVRKRVRKEHNFTLPGMPVGPSDPGTPTVSGMDIRPGSILALDVPPDYVSGALFSNLSNGNMVVVMGITTAYYPEKAALLFPVSL